jgi:hypothetical protein
VPAASGEPHNLSPQPRLTIEKAVQILALPDCDPSNNHEDNLAYLCLPHHDDYDSNRRQTKNLTERELKTARDRLYTYIDTGGDLIRAQ